MNQPSNPGGFHARVALIAVTAVTAVTALLAVIGPQAGRAADESSAIRPDALVPVESAPYASLASQSGIDWSALEPEEPIPQF